MGQRMSSYPPESSVVSQTQEHSLDPQLLYILTSIRVLCTPKVGQNMLFYVFYAEKLKKEKKQEVCCKNYPTHVFLSLHQNAGRRWKKC